jgi:signal transduction histidine kinase
LGNEPIGPDPHLLREITDLLPAYVAYVDADLRYVSANRMYVERFGRAEHQIVGQLVADVTGSAFENVAPHLRAALAVAHLPHRNALGQVVGIIIYGYDVTDRRQAEVALLRSEKLAAVGRLASSIAHEINNPLEAVVNLLYLIESSVKQDPDQAHRYAVQAQAELARVTQITTNTLRFFRQATVRSKVDMGELANSVLALYAGRLNNSSIQVTQRIGKEVSLLCYDGEVRQVLNNLLSNAIDAMRHGGRLHIRVRRMGSNVRITIADAGSGMSPGTQARIFEPFFTTKGATGTGLGLWIAQELVAKHKGRLHVRSREGKGTVMALLLSDEDQSKADRT